ncbi:uncharacterized protein A4U43_C07F10350 [Asparagus officinalis]|uniref:Uncharacterized protein n=1 Tax=Asparagus officinalis TaxID=4686 RepID=A0A5P1EG04_ASPOF|nr:uncharacterized protein A4U43_C07F10350 [Asparagus officinalis]
MISALAYRPSTLGKSDGTMEQAGMPSCEPQMTFMPVVGGAEDLQVGLKEEHQQEVGTHGGCWAAEGGVDEGGAGDEGGATGGTGAEDGGGGSATDAAMSLRQTGYGRS